MSGKIVTTNTKNCIQASLLILVLLFSMYPCVSLSGNFNERVEPLFVRKIKMLQHAVL